MAKKWFIGIDPGKSGALAIIHVSDSGMESVTITPFDEERYVMEVREIHINPGDKCVACVERVSAMPGQGVKSMFSFGANYGFIQGLLSMKRIPFETIPPQKWKKEYSLGKDKAASITTAKKLFPYVSFYKTERCKKEDDGMAEALLMAEYARRHL